ncbi:MAG: hypothetical protein FJ090_02900 [Deltaproteobacteria bacterium]|nr:hypothetical protein [Deltaproteobacteria bacterium]
MYPDLHRHLDGSLRPSTVLALSGAPMPEGYRFRAGMGLAAALRCFEFTLSLMQSLDAVRRVAAEACEDAAAEGVSTLELRFAPQLHGQPVPEVVDAALDGIAGRAGLILCGLYGEAPGVLEELVDIGASRPGVVGVDVAGGPSPVHRFGLVDYAGACQRARRLDLGVTVHAGEGRPPAEIAVAIEVLGAHRIGHGTSILDDETVVDLALRRGVTLEACPTSNMHTGVVPSVAAHPLQAWLRRGLRACVNTDNTLLSDVTSPEEHRRCGLSEADLAVVIAHGHAAAFNR